MCNSFCGVLTLQVGCVILAAVFMMLGVLAFAENVFDFHSDPSNDIPVPFIVVLVFAILMISAGIVMLLAAYNESITQCKVAIAILAITMVYWLIMSCISFANSPSLLRKVCVAERCAESLWLTDLKYRGDWRGRGVINNTTTTTTNGTTTTTTEEPGERRRRQNKEYDSNQNHILTYTKRNFLSNVDVEGFDIDRLHNPFGRRIIKRDDSEDDDGEVKEDDDQNQKGGDQAKEDDGEGKEDDDKKDDGKRKEDDGKGKKDDSKDKKDDGKGKKDDNEDKDEDSEQGGEDEYDETEKPVADGETKYVLGVVLAGAIIMFVLNLGTFIFAIIIMYSYSEELKWDFNGDEEKH